MGTGSRNRKRAAAPADGRMRPGEGGNNVDEGTLALTDFEANLAHKRRIPGWTRLSDVAAMLKQAGHRKRNALTEYKAATHFEGTNPSASFVFAENEMMDNATSDVP